MDAILLTVHVIGAIVFIGGATVATSLFPRVAPKAAAVVTGGEREVAGGRARGTAELLHRTTRIYGGAAAVVPAVGLVLAVLQDSLTEAWILWSIGLTAAAAVVLVAVVLPGQRAALAEPDDGTRLRKLGMTSGIFNTLWFVVAVLMVTRPGA